MTYSGQLAKLPLVPEQGRSQPRNAGLSWALARSGYHPGRSNGPVKSNLLRQNAAARTTSTPGDSCL